MHESCWGVHEQTLELGLFILLAHIQITARQFFFPQYMYVPIEELAHLSPSQYWMYHLTILHRSAFNFSKAPS